MTQIEQAQMQGAQSKTDDQYDDERQLVCFQLGGENYGVDIYSVQRLIQVPAITRVPRAPDFVEGIIDVRGDIIPVINLLKRFGSPRSEISDDDRIVITEIGDQIVGLLVDAVSEVTRLPEDDIEPPSEVVSGVHSEFIAGIGKQQRGDTSRLIIVLDVGKVLTEGQQDYLGGVAENGDETESETVEQGSSSLDEDAA